MVKVKVIVFVKVLLWFFVYFKKKSALALLWGQVLYWG